VAPIATASNNPKGQPDERHRNDPYRSHRPRRAGPRGQRHRGHHPPQPPIHPPVASGAGAVEHHAGDLHRHVHLRVRRRHPGRPAAAGRYVNWLVPGLLAQFALFGGSGTASGLAEDLTNGVIDRFRSLPMAGAAVLAGRTLSDLVRSALTLTLMVGVGYGIGFRPQTGFGGLLGALAVGLGFGYAWSWVMALLGLLVRSAEAVQAATYLVVFPLAFTSSVFVPTQTMPGWLQPFAANQPVTVASNALRSLVLGQGALPPGRTVAGQVVLALLWVVAITAVFVPLAVRAYRRTVS
jgi:ABC transporter DrrB family efflux protein